MGSCNRLTWGFLPSADPRGRACRRDRESAARKEPLLGGKKPTLPAGQPSGTDPRTFSPRPSSNWYGRQLACLCAHAYTDTKEEPTMPLLSSKIELPLTLSPRGERGCPLYSYTSTPAPRRLIPMGRWHIGPVRACPTAHRPMGTAGGGWGGTRPVRSG